MIDVSEVGAGGGSLAAIDIGGALRVGNLIAMLRPELIGEPPRVDAET